MLPVKKPLFFITFLLILFVSTGYADTLGVYSVPDFFSLPATGADTFYDILDENYTMWDFEYNVSGSHWYYMDGCDDDYSTTGGWEVQNWSACMSGDFINKTGLADKTILEVIHAFNSSGAKDTMSAIRAVDDDGYFHIYLQFAEAPLLTGAKYFMYIPYVEQLFTNDGTAYYRFNTNLMHTALDEYGFTPPAKQDSGDIAGNHKDYSYILWNSDNDTILYPNYFRDDPPAYRGLNALKIGNATFAFSWETAIGVHTFSDMGIINPQENGWQGVSLTCFWMDNGADWAGANDKRVCLNTITHANGGGFYTDEAYYFYPLGESIYKHIEGTIYAEYTDGTGAGINGATCTAIRTNPYALPADNTPPASTIYDNVTMVNVADGLYSVPFQYVPNVEYPIEGSYTYAISCEKAPFATLSQVLRTWVGESGGYADSSRFRIVSMEGEFDTVSAYDKKGNLLDIDSLNKKEVIDQVLFKIWERDNGYINNQMFGYTEDIEGRHERFQNADDYADYIDMAKDHYAVGIKLSSDDFYCNGNGLAYKITPASTYAGSASNYASLMHIGGASFGYSATEARNTFCLGVFTFQGFINWLPTVGSPYKYPINYCKGFSCYEPSTVDMQIMVCEEGSVSDCVKPHYLSVLTFSFGFGTMEFKYPQVININATSQQFYGRIFDASKGNPIVLEDINCTANLTGSDSTTIALGKFERFHFDALVKEFTPTVPQYNASQYNYSLYCSGVEDSYNPLFQTGIVYVGDMTLEQSRCEVIPNRFRPSTYVTTICELASRNAKTHSLGNFTIQYNVSVGNQSVIENITDRERTAQLIYEYTDLNYFRNQTTLGLQSLIDGAYNISIWGWDNNGNYPAFNKTIPIIVDSNVVDVSEYLVDVSDNVPNRGYFQTGDNYTCTVIWKDPEKELYKADIKISTVSETGELYDHVFLYQTYYQRGWDLPFDVPEILEDIYDIAHYDLRTDAYSLTYNLYYPLDECEDRGRYKIYNASSFEETDVFLDDVCEYLPLRQRDNIRCTWTLEFGTNLTSVGGSMYDQHVFRRKKTVQLWSFITSIFDESGISALFGDIVGWIKSNLLQFLLLIFLIIIVAIIITSRRGDDGGGRIIVIPQQGPVVGGSFTPNSGYTS